MGRRIMWSKDGTICTGMWWPDGRSVLSQSYADAYDDNEFVNRGGHNISTGFGTVLPEYFVWNFPDYVTLDEIRFNASSMSGYSHDGFYFEVCPSGDTSNGMDGTWIEVAPQTYTRSTYYTYSIALTPTSTRWFRMRGYGSDHSSGRASINYNNLHLYGDYAVEDYILYDNEPASSPITDWREYLSTANAPDHEDYFAETKQFKIYNNSAEEQTYTIYCESGFSPYTDPVIVDTYTISKDGGVTRVTNLTTAPVQAGFFSEVIDVNYSLTAIANPKDGYHQMRIIIEEDPKP